ncbi:nucleolar complex protein 14 [Arachnomyces sp. PD_36]|nr:nucleolar complex protein 14 [Arachnomyces sp. PD_36]
MAPSQLKQLKTSLRESGVVGPQQSKKQKKRNAKSGAATQNKIQRNNALQGIRDQFNPFEIKGPARAPKFDVATRPIPGAKEPQFRPGVTKGLGEERRRETLLKEIHRRNRVGGILDRRFGENDPTMTPEERAAERFARESQKKFKKESMFNLEEDDDEEEFQFTHLGQSLSFDQDDDLVGSDEENYSDNEQVRKRKRMAEDDDMGGMAGESEDEQEQEEGQPERKKSKNEVMKELIAKSKFHKYERQKAREDDDDLRAELDKGLPDIFQMMQAPKKPIEPAPQPREDPTASMNPDRLALLNGEGRKKPDEYDQRLKQMTYDKRSMPMDRTKTEEEKAEEEAGRLRALERERLRRMQGDQDQGSDEEGDKEAADSEEDSELDDAKAFGLGQTVNERPSQSEMGVEDEDDFIIDDDLVESDSEAELSIDDSDASHSADEESEDEDDEFINGLTLPVDPHTNAPSTAAGDAKAADTSKDGMAYTYPCPENHEQFLETIADVPIENLPTVVQRIRALHHPRLNSDNKSKLGVFSKVLIEHVAYLANKPERPPFAVIENLLRHIHSLAKTHPTDVASAFRNHLTDMSDNRPLKLLPGDLVALTGIATIFPTSDHFHAVVTPAILSISRYLGQSTIHSLADLGAGAYACSLCLQYQSLSKRYIPESMNYVLNALSQLSPTESKKPLGFFPTRNPTQSLRLKGSKSAKKPQFWDLFERKDSSMDPEELKVSLVQTFTSLLSAAADLWAAKSAFYEIFEPALNILRHLKKSCSKKLPTTVQDQIQSTSDKIQRLLEQATITRRPLLLHNHKPLAIKTSIPKFEESFNPDKHYDPDRERAELNKLKAEHKRERKGAVRELRKDANFIARESLREKKEKDAAYEKKYKRLIAEIQGEEGKEANAYERERKARKSRT